MSAAQVSTMRPRPVRWPWLAVVGFLAIVVVGLGLAGSNGTGVVDDLPFVLAFGMFGAVGALIMSRKPGHRIGGLLLYGSCATAVSAFSGELTTSLVRHGESDGVVVVAAALASNVGWLLGILPVSFLLPLLFPDGHLPSRRWLPVPVATIAFLALIFVGFVFGERRLSGSVGELTVANPLFVPAVSRMAVPDVALSIGLLAALVASVAASVVRFRRSRALERQQIKWVALAFLFLVVSFVVSEVLFALGHESPWIDAALTAPAFLAVPVAIGIGVLQYRLYDLDIVVRKALIAGALVVFGIAVYGGAVWGVGAIASERAGSATLFVVALVLGLAFRPAMNVTRKIADRLVYGRRATPYEVLTQFSERVGEAYATDDILGRMAQILGQGVGALGARVWLLVSGELRPASSWPADAPRASPIAVPGDTLPGLPGEFTIEVRDHGELLGALSVTMPPNDPMTPAKARLVHDLASHAGLALRNVRLVEELKASQRRIVAAQDQERRKLERNIHDGAQQQLVALAVKARLARHLTERAPGKAAEMLNQIEAETQSALEDLRDLARGIYPPLLADRGLAAALEAQARKSPASVTVEARGVLRYPPEVEAAVYFSVLEALQNVAKYAQATHATVALSQENGYLEFAVTDDGRGFDPSSTGYGTGLQGISDRLAALEGTIAVTSSPGAGTTLSGRLPLEGAER